MKKRRNVISGGGVVFLWFLAWIVPSASAGLLQIDSCISNITSGHQNDLSLVNEEINRRVSAENLKDGTAAIFATASRGPVSVPRAVEPEAAIVIAASLLVLSFLGLRLAYRKTRRILDIFGSVLALIALSPVLAVTALLIKIDSPGPVLIKQVRVGLNRRRTARRGVPRFSDRRGVENFGTLFNVYKLRTMRVNAETVTGPVWARENDDRVTRVGRILRMTRLDEVPQFVNVLRGEMSIIGPRPERPVFMSALHSTIRGYTDRLIVKPGITGLAQIRYHYTSSIEDTRIKLKYDLLYVKRNSPLMDMWIIMQTLGTVIFARGAR